MAEHTIMQNNDSAHKLEVNGQASSGKRTRHMNVRYIFIKDRVDSGEVSIQHCPTDDMVGDYFTKPLQGSKFVRFRNLIMVYEEHDMKLEHASLVSPRSVLDNV